jgi:ribosomal protein S18 acetylase RimI-like enzyme
MQVRSLGHRTDLMVRRLTGSVIEDRGDWLAVHTPGNPAFWWGNCLLAAEPLRAGSAALWARRFAAEFPDAAHRALGVDGSRGEIGDPAVVAGLGLTVDCMTVLTAQGLVPPPRPSAVCRALRDDGDWNQALELAAACQRGQEAGYLDYRARKLAAARQAVESGRAGWFGAFVDDRLVASLGVVGDGSGVARYQDVETHPDYRRRGLARGLLSDAGRHAADRLGGRTLVIVADPAYHAIELYRSLGFRDVEYQIQALRAPDRAG